MTAAIDKAATTAITAPEQSTLALAIQNGMPPETISKLMDLQERWEANQARKQYVAAMAAFKLECPAVLGKDHRVDFVNKTGGRTKYSHATIGAIVEKITPALSKNGLSISWETKQDGARVTVTCHVTHAGGHRESTPLTGPNDESGSKNPIQSIGSSVTYLQRYTMVCALGLATADQDDADMPPDTRPPVQMPQERAPEQAPAGNTVTGLIEDVQIKSGKNAKGGDWTRYGVKVQGAMYGTFDATLGNKALAMREAAEEVVIVFATDAKGYHTMESLEFAAK